MSKVERFHTPEEIARIDLAIHMIAVGDHEYCCVALNYGMFGIHNMPELALRFAEFHGLKPDMPFEMPFASSKADCSLFRQERLREFREAFIDPEAPRG